MLGRSPVETELDCPLQLAARANSSSARLLANFINIASAFVK